ncbi:MAG: LytTR family transcriptional regulator [Clostridiales bacterium]|nr:LytTR family transcriptional regulator [Clostridiales bacterium]
MAYIEVALNTCNVYMAGGARHSVRKALAEFEAELPPFSFAKPHKSYLVNFEFILRALKCENEIELAGFRQKIPISRRNKKEFWEHYRKYMRS